MLVVCRVCASEYSIGASARQAGACRACDDAPVAAARIVCAPEQPLRLAPPGRERGLPPPQAGRRTRTSRPVIQRLRALCRSPIVLGGLAACAAMTAVVARAAIVTAVPQTAILYAAAGLPVHLGGVVLRETTSRLESQDGQPILIVQGRIENVTRGRVSLPHVAIVVRGRAGETLYRWQVAPARPDLGAGEATSFRGRLAAPPAGMNDVELALVQGGPRLASAAP